MNRGKVSFDIDYFLVKDIPTTIIIEKDSTHATISGIINGCGEEMHYDDASTWENIAEAVTFLLMEINQEDNWQYDISNIGDNYSFVDVVAFVTHPIQPISYDGFMAAHWHVFTAKLISTTSK